MMEKFDQATGKASDNILAQTLNGKDKSLSEMADGGGKKIDWDKLISNIQGKQSSPEITSPKSEEAKHIPPHKQQAPSKSPTNLVKDKLEEIGRTAGKNILAKEGAGKLPIPTVSPEQGKKLLGMKDPNEQEKYIKTLILKDVMDGKIKTPIPAPLIRPIVKVEETYNNFSDKADAIAQKVDAKIGRGGGEHSVIDKSPISNHLEQERKKQEEQKITLQDIDNLDKKKSDAGGGSSDDEKPPQDELASLVSKISPIGADMEKVGKTKLQP